MVINNYNDEQWNTSIFKSRHLKYLRKMFFTEIILVWNYLSFFKFIY